MIRVLAIWSWVSVSSALVMMVTAFQYLATHGPTGNRWIPIVLFSFIISAVVSRLVLIHLTKKHEEYHEDPAQNTEVK